MTIRTAVIGVGAMGRNHARVYSDLPGVGLVGVADLDARLPRPSQRSSALRRTPTSRKC